MKAPSPSSGGNRKTRYHHGDLRSSALARGQEVVARSGPAALTLRGIARDLGVSATALVRHFGRIAMFRAAVAEAAMEEAQTVSGLATGSRVPVEEAARAWIAYAGANPNLYRLLSGEGWHAPGGGRNGIFGVLATPSPRRRIEDTLLGGSRRFGHPRGDREPARYVAATLHGLALARIDGVPEASVARALERALRPEPGIERSGSQRRPPG